MIRIDAERCSGCGVCLESCPAGAIYLVDGKAAVDVALCRNCPAMLVANTATSMPPCTAACPQEAIVYTPQVSRPQAPRVPVPAPRPEPRVIQVKTHPAPVALRARVLPAVGAALVWAGRELVPRLADYALDNLDRWTAGNGGAGKRQRRQRRRGS